ncbi:MAG: gluconeogenesis factor YvcK family protein [Desulforhopalus sp.]
MKKIEDISAIRLSPLDLLPQQDLREKIVSLVLRGVPPGINSVAKLHLSDLRRELLTTSVEDVKVVVFGGGTGLSNIIGGDSRLASWLQNPFSGLKEIFPKTHSIVCVTDSGGSTGELLKDLPLVAIGDLRHVLLSSIQLALLQKKYALNRSDAGQVVATLSAIFNWRFTGPLTKVHEGYRKIAVAIGTLPHSLHQYLGFLTNLLFTDKRLARVIDRSHCFGNLLLTAAIYNELDRGIANEELAENQALMHMPIRTGLGKLAKAIGANERAVLPCTSTPAQLCVNYTNGVAVTGEHKLDKAQRGIPVESVEVEYCDFVRVHEEIFEDIRQADIIVLAPGSLYSSIIPVFKVPGLAESVRRNKKALKILISNLWVQSGETDLSIVDPERKFHVSDMIRAYEKNIPGGTVGLFNEVICISLEDIPGSVLQRYAVEGKIPIFLDRSALEQQKYTPIECGVYSRNALYERGVIQHDPETLALAIKGLYNSRRAAIDLPPDKGGGPDFLTAANTSKKSFNLVPFRRYLGIQQHLARLEIKFVGGVDHVSELWLKETLGEILWDHPIIPLDHLNYCVGVQCIGGTAWNRDQKWDNVFSFFDPEDQYIKIRGDQIQDRKKLEVALMIALGESLLGDYAEKKVMNDVLAENLFLGRVYHLFLKKRGQMNCYLNWTDLQTFLVLARMSRTDDDRHYTRLVNKDEGFTPPGLMMGLMYAWYVDNRLATLIEYKMSILKIKQTDLIPEQMKMAERRRQMISFFKEVVFRKSPPARFSETSG